MATRYDELLRGALQWLPELDRRLHTEQRDDVVVPYEQVALAFPAQEPNPRSFDIPLIDQHRLRAWASARGWMVRFATDMVAQGETRNPPVRFTRQD